MNMNAHEIPDASSIAIGAVLLVVLSIIIAFGIVLSSGYSSRGDRKQTKDE